MDKKQKFNAIVKGNQPKDQKHSSDTKAKVLNGIHRRTHIADKSTRKHDVCIA